MDEMQKLDMALFLLSEVMRLLIEIELDDAEACATLGGRDAVKRQMADIVDVEKYLHGRKTHLQH